MIAYETSGASAQPPISASARLTSSCRSECRALNRRSRSAPCQLTEMRMRRAWELLETGCQVAQAAYRVGYCHPANFSAAFTRFHGRAPKSVFGKRR